MMIVGVACAGDVMEMLVIMGSVIDSTGTNTGSCKKA
jgi:hypothetical protein